MKRKSEGSIPEEVLWTLFETDVPLTTYAISKKLHRSNQIVSYHINRFLELGVIEVDKGTERNLYYLNPLLYDKGLFLAFKNALTPIVTVISKQSTSQKQVISILQASLTLFSRSISKEFLNTALNNGRDNDKIR